MNTNRLRDFRVKLICLSIAVLCIVWFCRDFNQTIESLDKEPVGTVSYRKNTVQRRLADRVLWDRLFEESKVYNGDRVLTAKNSNVKLLIDGKHDLNLSENTMIVIRRDQIELDSGEIDFSGGKEGGNITLSVKGQLLEMVIGAGMVVNISAGEDGPVFQISEGEGKVTVVDKERGTRWVLTQGEMLSLDAEGKERTYPAAVVMRPRPNARFIKNGDQPLNVSFAWNRINLEPQETLHLEIARDRNFSRALPVLENLDSSTEAVLDSGLWHWRLLSSAGVVLVDRWLFVTDASTELLSPARNAFRYETEPLHFQWTETADASYYELEVDKSSYFFNPKKWQVAVNSFFNSSLEAGTWYWRVRPVFSSVYEETADKYYSDSSFFYIIPAGESIPEPVTVQKPDLKPQTVQPATKPTTPPKLVQPQPLPPPKLIQPEKGQNFGPKEPAHIIFRWSKIDEANTYIFTLFTDDGKGKIINEKQINENEYKFDEIGQLRVNGTYNWQVKAVYRRGGKTERDGKIEKSFFEYYIYIQDEVRLKNEDDD